MTGWVVLLLVVALVCAYFATGKHVARKRMPAIWESARRNWHFDDSIRGSVRMQTIGTVLGWPIVLGWLAMCSRLDEFTIHGDPEELAQKLAERDKRISELEREAGIRP